MSTQEVRDAHTFLISPLSLEIANVVNELGSEMCRILSIIKEQEAGLLLNETLERADAEIAKCKSTIQETLQGTLEKLKIQQELESRNLDPEKRAAFLAKAKIELDSVVTR